MKDIKVVPIVVTVGPDGYTSYTWDKLGGRISEGDIIRVSGSDTMDGEYIVGLRIGAFCRDCPFSYMVNTDIRICTMWRKTKKGLSKVLCTTDARSSSWAHPAYTFTKITTVMEEL